MLKRLSYKYLLSGAVIILLTLIALRPSTGEAQDKSKYSESENVGFAFYNFSKSKPEFKDWITDMDNYKKARPVEKMEMMHQEIYRLENGFFNYHPDENLISLNMEALVKSSNYFAESQKKGALTDVNITLADLPENYFPFYIGGVWIAVVIKDFEDLTNFTFTGDEYQEFAEKLNFNRHAYALSQKVGVDFKLRPLSVDTSAPIELDGIEMWLMLVEIGEMVMWRKHRNERQILLTHKAPWFITEGHKDLLRLYRN